MSLLCGPIPIVRRKGVALEKEEGFEAQSRLLRSIIMLGRWNNGHIVTMREISERKMSTGHTSMMKVPMIVLDFGCMS
jgi:hypothetical protein